MQVFWSLFEIMKNGVRSETEIASWDEGARMFGSRMAHYFGEYVTKAKNKINISWGREDQK